MRFVDACVLDVTDNMLPSNFLAANFKASYAHYIRVAKILIKNESVLPLLVGPGMDVPVVKTLGITHLEEPSLFFPLRRTVFS